MTSTALPSMAGRVDLSADAGGAAVVVRGLRRSFGRTVALDGLDLHVPTGAIFGLLGNNGAGKTTTLHTLMGFLPPMRGSVSVLGCDPVTEAIAIRRQVGFVAERDEPYGWMRLEQYFRMGQMAYPDWDGALCQSLCSVLELDTRKRFKECSKGMVAKAKLIFALAHRPRLLILDEPTSGLDPGSRYQLLEQLRIHVREHGGTVILSTHLLEDITNVATHIGIMHRGKRLFSSTMQAVDDELAVISLPASGADPLPEVPEALAETVVAVRSDRLHGTQWLLRDGAHPEVAGLLAQEPAWMGPHRVELRDLFLFLTTGTPGRAADALPGAVVVPGPMAP